MKSRIRIIQGGMGAGKNYAMAIYLLERQDARVITIMTDTYDNLQDGVINDYENIFSWSGLNFYNFYNQKHRVLTWGNSKIQFRYLADHKGQSGKSKRREILYINEGNRVGWAAVEHFIARSGEVFVDHNPDQDYWCMEELEPRDDCEKIIVTYKDNEKCPKNEVQYIESRRHKTEWFRVYGLGQVGTYSERRIYQFEVAEEIPETAIQIASGMDFGKSPDPTVLMDCYIDGVSLYIKEVFSENNLLPERIPGAERMCISDKMEEVGFEKNHLIIGDSAGATELRDLKKHGYNVRGVKKGPSSVLTGMKRLGSYDIKIHKESTATIKAFSNWLYDLDNNGKVLPQPPKAHEPDQIAAVRYVAMARPLWDHLIPKVKESA